MSTLTFQEVSATNAKRCDRWHEGFPPRESSALPSDQWNGADWSNAMQGEAGEAGNVVKKLRRLETGIGGNRKTGDLTREDLLGKLGEELADAFLYMDLLATFYGIDLAEAVRGKFNSISVEMGFPERL